MNMTEKEFVNDRINRLLQYRTCPICLNKMRKRMANIDLFCENCGLTVELSDFVSEIDIRNYLKKVLADKIKAVRFVEMIEEL